MSIVSRFPNLDWALSGNPHVKTALSTLYAARPKYLAELDSLINELRKGKCQKIREKMNDVNDLQKFRSTLAELRIGRYLLHHGKSIVFLPDNYMSGKNPPDILVNDASGQYFVEVKLFTEDDICTEVILEGLRSFLTTSKFNVFVDIELGKELSTPKTTYGERSAKEKLAKTTLQEFQNKFNKINFSKLPARVTTQEATFIVKTSPVKRSMVEAMRTCVILLPAELREKLKRDVCTKASKRKSWKGADLLQPFVVAVYTEQWGIDIDDAKYVLFGERCTIAGSTPMPKITIPPVIQHAAKRGWRAYLQAEYLLPYKRTYLVWNNRGIYFTESVTKNVSGVIVGDESSSFSFIPNPFCDAQINNPNIITFL